MLLLLLRHSIGEKGYSVQWERGLTVSLAGGVGDSDLLSVLWPPP